MRSNINVYGVLGFCFLTLAITYTTWNLISNGYVEWFGTIAFTFSTALMWWLTTYLWIARRKQGGELPEDSLDADMDTDAEIGHFYASSWWPIVLAFACSLVVFGLAVGFWLILFALPILIISLIGWVYEGYRGQYAR